MKGDESGKKNIAILNKCTLKFNSEGLNSGGEVKGCYLES